MDFHYCFKTYWSVNYVNTYVYQCPNIWPPANKMEKIKVEIANCFKKWDQNPWGQRHSIRR